MGASEAAHLVPGKRERRVSPRHQLALGGRIRWRDRAGVGQTASIITRDVSEFGAFIEIVGRPCTIPLYRLVSLQLDLTGFSGRQLPDVLRQKLLTVVVRTAAIDGKSQFHVPTGYVLRLLVEPRREATPGAYPSVAQRVA